MALRKPVDRQGAWIFWRIAALTFAAGCSEPVPQELPADPEESEEIKDFDLQPGPYDVKGKGDGPGNPCAYDPAKTVIDGDFSPGEWPCHVPMPGKFSYLYLRLEGERLHVLNDWLLRDDKPVTPAMYNLFQFSTGDGAQAWDLRVYGDNHVEVKLNGQPAPIAEGASGFHPSPNQAKPHTIFEFALGDHQNPVQPGACYFMNHDPGNASDDPAGSLVQEPTVFGAYLADDGTTEASPVPGPALISFASGVVEPGSDVTVLAAGLGVAAGQVHVQYKAAKLLAWSESGLTFRAPTVAGEYGIEAVTAAGATSNTLELLVKEPASGDCASQGPGRPCDDGDPCTIGAKCNDQGQCVATNLSCDDDNACTTLDLCAKGVCKGMGVLACSDDKPCMDAGCVPAQGCVLTVTSGAACQDGNACTAGDACTASGSCAGKPGPSCEDGNACTSDTCDPKLGCVHTPLATGTPCSDDDACSQGDSCNSGSCKGIAKVLPAAPLCHKAVCDPKTGALSTLALSGTPCADNQLCTDPDLCVEGVCFGTPVTCDDDNPCTADTCNPASGKCSHQPLAEQAVCDDGNACTVQETCTQTKCVGKVLVCDDGDASTKDACWPQVGCVFTPK
ncbi:MAG: hypothetical protein HY902_18550 [Deltaproteobacteria bacterium]|nr:hypothetical protein [Deltaproteobacteria bacterium]